MKCRWPDFHILFTHHNTSGQPNPFVVCQTTYMTFVLAGRRGKGHHPLHHPQQQKRQHRIFENAEPHQRHAVQGGFSTWSEVRLMWPHSEPLTSVAPFQLAFAPLNALSPVPCRPNGGCTYWVIRLHWKPMPQTLQCGVRCVKDMIYCGIERMRTNERMRRNVCTWTNRPEGEISVGKAVQGCPTWKDHPTLD